MAAGEEGPMWGSVPSRCRRDNIIRTRRRGGLMCDLGTRERWRRLSAATQPADAYSYYDYPPLPTFPPGHVLRDCAKETS